MRSVVSASLFLRGVYVPARSIHRLLRSLAAAHFPYRFSPHPGAAALRHSSSPSPPSPLQNLLLQLEIAELFEIEYKNHYKILTVFDKEYYTAGSLGSSNFEQYVLVRTSQNAPLPLN